MGEIGKELLVRGGDVDLHDLGEAQVLLGQLFRTVAVDREAIAAPDELVARLHQIRIVAQASG